MLRQIEVSRAHLGESYCEVLEETQVSCTLGWLMTTSNCSTSTKAVEYQMLVLVHDLLLLLCSEPDDWVSLYVVVYLLSLNLLHFLLLCVNYELWAPTRPVSLLMSLDFGFWNSHYFVTVLHSGVTLHFTYLVTGGYNEPTEGHMLNLRTDSFVLPHSGLQEASECGIFHSSGLYPGMVPQKSVASGLLLSDST